MTIICRNVVFNIRGHPTGEMLKCQEAGNRQETLILKFRKQKDSLSEKVPYYSIITDTQRIQSLDPKCSKPENIL